MTCKGFSSSRREYVEKLLEFYKDTNIIYKNIKICQARLNALPTDAIPQNWKRISEKEFESPWQPKGFQACHIILPSEVLSVVKFKCSTPHVLQNSLKTVHVT